jgi:hypothetical protein
LARLLGHLGDCGVAASFFLFVLVFDLEVATTLRVYGYFAATVLWVEAMALRLRHMT